jgi:predicted small lipoprotein YifL
MCRPFGECFVIRFDRPAFRIAATSALVLALGLSLSACGRRGPLDPPPGAYATQQGIIELDAEGRPIAPPGERKRLPIDALLD